MESVMTSHLQVRDIQLALHQHVSELKRADTDKVSVLLWMMVDTFRSSKAYLKARDDKTKGAAAATVVRVYREGSARSIPS